MSLNVRYNHVKQCCRSNSTNSVIACGFAEIIKVELSLLAVQQLQTDRFTRWNKQSNNSYILMVVGDAKLVKNDVHYKKHKPLFKLKRGLTR